jgi:ABC-type lipoprotein release transport system permease subunit|tara:strand:+ start:309 stop:461 length:153 start_codon:yes stop_codon:yes gene_type:complete
MITDILTFLVCIILGFITVNILSALIVLYNYKKKEKAKNNLVKWDIDKEA